MKVIEIMDNLAVAGGVNSFVYDLCSALKRQGTDVSLIAIMENHGVTNSQVEAIRSVGVKVICLGAKNKKDALLNYIPKLRREIRNISQMEQTVCNLHLKLSVLMGSLASIGLRNVKIVETYHSLYSRYWLQSFVLQGCIKKYIACSKSAQKEMENRFSISKRKIICIPNGVDKKSIEQIAEEYVPSNITHIVSVGRFTKQKNFTMTCRAFSNICSPQIKYTIIGTGDLEKQIIDARNGNENIEIKNPLNRIDIIKLVSSADLVVMPSLWEGLSIFLLETISVGTPLVLSDIPSFTDTMNEQPLDRNETWRICSWGYLVSNNTEQGYQEAIKHYLLNKSIRNEMSNTIKTISDKYDIDATAKTYNETYLKLFHGSEEI